MAQPTKTVRAKPGVTVHLPGGSVGFTQRDGAFPMHVEHAKALADHLDIEDEEASPAGQPMIGPRAAGDPAA